MAAIRQDLQLHSMPPDVAPVVDAMTDLDETVIYTDSTTPTFLAIAAGNYADADLALWRVKTALGQAEPTPNQAAHIEQLRGRRKETYYDLIAWAMIAEAERLEKGA